MEWALLGINIVFTLANIFYSIKLKKKSNKIRQKSTEQNADLVDFLSDIKIHGYSVVRVDPNNIFYRGTKR